MNFLVKQMLTVLGILLAFTLSCQATNYTWTGLASAAWETPGNWSVGGVTATTTPGSSDNTDNVTIGACAGYAPSLNSTVTIATFTMSACTLSISAGNTLNITGAATISGTNTTITGAGSLAIGTLSSYAYAVSIGSQTTSNTIVSPASVTIYCNYNISYYNSVFNNLSLIAYTNVVNSKNGGNIYNGSTLIQNTGNYPLYLGNIAPGDVYNGNVTLGNMYVGGGGGLYPSTAYTTQYNGNITISCMGGGSGGLSFGASGGTSVVTGVVSAGTLTAGTIGFYNFTQLGTAPQTINGTVNGGNIDVTFGSCTFNGPLTLSNIFYLNFNSGATFANSVNATAALLYLNGSHFKGITNLTQSWSGAYTSSYSTGGNTFDASTTITNNTGNYYWMVLNTTAGDIFNSDVTYTNAAGTFEIGTGAGNTYYGKVTYNYNPGLGFGMYCSLAGNTTYHGTVTYNQNTSHAHALYAINSGTVTYNDSVIFNQNGTSELAGSYGGNTTYNGHIVFNCNSSGQIDFGAGGGTSTLALGKTITAGTFTSGTLNLTNFTQQGNTSQQLDLAGGMLYITNSVFGGNFESTCQYHCIGSTQFLSTSSFTKTGPSSNWWYGGNTYTGTAIFTDNGGPLTLSNAPETFNGGANFINNTSNTLAISNTGTAVGNTHKGDVTLTNNSSGYIYPSWNGTSNYYGNIIINGGNPAGVKIGWTGYGTTVFCGSGNQSISSSAAVISSSITVNKPSGNLVLNTPVNMMQGVALTLTSGNIVTTSTNLLTISNPSYLVGGSANSFISGAVSKYGNVAFTFPVGKGTSYGPVSISAPSTNSTITAEYFNTPPTGTIATGTTLSSCQYWNLSGASGVQVSFAWDGLNCDKIQESGMSIASLSGTTWTPLASNASGNNEKGSIITTSTTTLGSFTFAFTSNPCPTFYNDPGITWVNVQKFDYNGNLISESRTYSDGFGKTMQVQSRNLINNTIMAQSIINDALNRPTIKTLPAPISGNCFTYNANFVVDQTTGQPYSSNSFDLPANINNPDPVSTAANSVGAYYSTSNILEPYTPVTSYPYSRVAYNDLLGGTLTKVSLPGEALKMGSGNENLSVTMPVLNELNQYASLRQNYVPETVPVNTDLTLQCSKKISRDANGQETVSFYDTKGLLLATALSGTVNGANVNSISTNTETCYTLLILDALYLENFSVSTSNPSASISIYTINIFGNSVLVYSGPASNAPSNFTSKLSAIELNIISMSPFTVAYNTNTQQYTASSTTSYPGIGVSDYLDVHLPNGVNNSLTIISPELISGAPIGYKIVDLDKGTDYTTAYQAGNLPPGYYRIYSTIEYLIVNINSNYYNFSYYYYDDAGRLVASLSPNAVNTITNAPPSATTTYTYQSLATTYIYNSVGQVTKRTTPDEGSTWYVYRNDGKVRFSQNAQQANDNKFSYVAYDNVGRAVETGEYNSASGTFFFEPQALPAFFVSEGFTITGITSPYSVLNLIDNNLIIPPQPDNTSPHGGLQDVSGTTTCANCHTISATVYDIPAADATITTLPGTGITANTLPTSRTQQFLDGGVSFSYKLINGNDPSTACKTYYSYDYLDRGAWTLKEITDPLFSTISPGQKTIDYTYNNDGTLFSNVYQNATATERFEHDYYYDAHKRLQNVYAALGNNTPTEQAEYLYYTHGPLKRLELAGDLQGIDYTYTVNGWLKAINHPALDSRDPGADGFAGTNANFNKDYFGMSLDYYTNSYTDYTAANGAAFGNFNLITDDGNTYSDYFNGNIKGQKWQTQGQAIVSNGTSYMPSYTYLYDNQYQLTQAYSGYADLATGQNFTQTNTYNAILSYDNNGNILSAGLNNTTPMIYAIAPNNNQLQSTSITELNTASANYTYNYNGQLTSCISALPGQLSKYIQYDAFGNVTSVYTDATKTQLLATFLYDEDGNRIRKTNYLQPGNVPHLHTWYVRDGSGTVVSIYHTDAIAGTPTAQLEIPIYGSGRLGNVSLANAVSQFEYELTDHLGNVRAVVGNTANTGIIGLLSWADYTPLGAVMPGRNSIGSPGYRYGYQGQFSEMDNETGLNNFDFRAYDPNIGRWLCPDKARVFHSPYIGMANNWANFIDPDGAFPYTFHIRSFYPGKSFGGGFMGDSRGFTTERFGVSSRIAQHFTFDPQTAKITNAGFSDNYSSHPLFGAASEDLSGSFSPVRSTGSGFEFTANYAGSNRVLPYAPDIDVHSKISINEDLVNGRLSLSANITGDAFPNTEAFISDQFGNSVFIGKARLQGNVFTSLWGNGSKDIMKANFQIGIDNEGAFKNVIMGDKTYSIGDWNSGIPIK